ncbi:MAG: hypothetical protein JO227_02895, partial [Acetobacteraceae bacterium]|nr:hypothetical protein [Acetobacteraceae bacterium]
PEDPPALRLAKLEAFLSGASAEDVNLIASLMQLPIEPASPVLQFSIQRRRERTLQALLQVLIRTAHQRPVLAVMEDAHWSDPTTAELVSLVAREGASLPLCLVITARPEFIPDWIAHAGVKHVLLQPLGSEHSAELVRSMSGSDALTETIVRAIVTRSDGVPLFLEELTQSVLERTSGEGSYAEVVPASIHASLLARLDRLGQARAVVEAAATIGRDFDSELLKHVHEGDDDSLNAALRLLVDADLAFPVGPPGSGKFRFKHALIQDTAYNTMLRERRRLMHGRIAQALVTHFQQMAAAEPQILAHHYTEAGLNDRAAEWWLRAGAQSLRRAATDEAMAQLRRGLALCQTLPETELRQRLELDLQIMICKSLIATKGHGADSFSSHLACAKALCAKLHEPPQLLTILFQEWTRSVFWGDLVLARQQTEQLSGLARTRQGPLWELLASYTGGFTHFILGQFDEAHRLMRRGLDVFEPSRRDEYASHYVGDPRSMLRTFLAWERTCTGHLTEAIAVSDAAISEARALGNTYSLANALGTRGSIHSFIGTVEEGLAAADELQLLADEYGIAYFRGTAACLRGWFQSRLGDPDGGLNLVREGQEIYRRIGIRLHMPMALRFEADLLGRRDCLAEGFAKIAEARAVAADTDQFWDYAETLRVEGELLGRAGDRDAAETALRKAYSTALEEGARLFALRARLSLAALQCRNNRDTDMAAALAWFGSISDLPDVSRARQLLEDLQWMM